MKVSSGVVCCGWNGFGQLGNGTCDFSDVPSQVSSESWSGDVAQVCAGGLHFAGFTLVLLTNGHVYGWGDNRVGQLGLSGGVSFKTPQKIQENVAFVACGSQHSVLVLKDGTVVGHGDNTFSQLPAALERDVKVVSAACGDAHTLLLTSKGKVLSFGQARVDLSSFNEHVKQIAAGQNHSLLVLEDGRCVAFGSNTHGQIGIAGASHEVRTPVHVPLNEKCVAVAAGNFHSLVLTESGQVWGWGSNGEEQLEMSSEQHPVVTSPIQMSGIQKKAKHICAGGLHSVALLEDGSLWSAGCNSELQRNFPLNAHVTHVSASETHTVLHVQ